MISGWWLVGASWVFFVVLIWHGRMTYRHGIWDGAFNHFLPVVRREMLFYDKRRAEMIFEQDRTST
jgi:hypothetical protein